MLRYYSNSMKQKELSFHKFPQDDTVRTKWIGNIKQKDFVPTEHHRVCS